MSSHHTAILRGAEKNPRILSRLGIARPTSIRMVSFAMKKRPSSTGYHHTTTGSGGVDGPERALAGLRCVLILWVLADHFMRRGRHAALVKRFYIDTGL